MEQQSIVPPTSPVLHVSPLKLGRLLILGFVILCLQRLQTSNLKVWTEKSNTDEIFRESNTSFSPLWTTATTDKTIEFREQHEVPVEWIAAFRSYLVDNKTLILSYNKPNPKMILQNYSCRATMVTKQVELTTNPVAFKFLNPYVSKEYWTWAMIQLNARRGCNSSEPTNTVLFVGKALIPSQYQHLYVEGSSFVNGFFGMDAIGGPKDLELEVREEFALKYGCELTETLNIMPKSYDLGRMESCCAFFSNPLNGETLWALKPALSGGGRGITIENGFSATINRFRSSCYAENCSTTVITTNKTQERRAKDRFVVQRVILNPLLIENRKFDIRTFIFVASTKPFLVYHRSGHLIRSLVNYSEIDISSKQYRDKFVANSNAAMKSDVPDSVKLSHHWSMREFQHYLSRHKITTDDWVEDIFENRVKKVERFIVEAAKSRITPTPGAFTLIGVDWVIDTDLKIHLLEANTTPGMNMAGKKLPLRSDYYVGLYLDIVLESIDVVTTIQTQDDDGSGWFSNSPAGTKFRKFEVILNDYFDANCGIEHIEYNPCNNIW